MRKLTKEKRNFTVTPEVWKGLQAYAESIGASSSFVIETLIREKLIQIKQEKNG